MDELWKGPTERPKRPYHRSGIDVTFTQKLEGAIKSRLMKNIRDHNKTDLEDRKSLWEIYKEVREMRLADAYFNEMLKEKKENPDLTDYLEP